jgi:hypothetical protein
MQHDMDVANASGAAVRADINNALLALASSNSGPTAPATTFAYMWWPDTTSDIMKQRNAANTDWVDIFTLSTGAQAAALKGYLFGCTMSTTGGSSTMSIAAGIAADSAGVKLMSLSAIAKTTAAWSAGTAAGGLDTGSIANNTWYHFYVIRRPDTGVVDVLLSSSAIAPTMPANYTQYRRIGAGKTNGSAQWIAFTQDGDYFVWAASVVDVQTTNPGTASVTATLGSVPAGVKVDARGIASYIDSVAGAGYWWIRDLSANDEAPAPANMVYVQQTFGAGAAANSPVTIRTNTSAQIGYRVSPSTATVTFQFRTIGWTDFRGRVA